MFIAVSYAARVNHPRDPISPHEPMAAPRRARLPAARARASGTRVRWQDGQAWARAHWRWLAVAGLGFVVVLAALRQPLADLIWPQNRTQALLVQAETALARGHLSAADGSGARELFEAAAAMDPDRGEPVQGLARVADAAVAQAQAALQADDVAGTHAALGLARALSAPRQAVEPVAAQLRAREAAHAGLDALWAQAQAAQASGHLHGAPDAALPLYARILEFEPGDAQVLRAREDAIAEVLQQAREDLRGGALGPAAAAIAVARGYDPGHMDLPDTQARLAEEREAALQRAHADLDAGRIERASAGYQALLAIDPQAEDAQAGLVQAGLALAQRAVRLAGDFRFSDADAALAQARTLAPGHEAVEAAAGRVDTSRQLRAQMTPQMPAQQRRAQVRALLEQAQAAEARGDLLTPPGDSAYDKLRAARALAPDDREVQQATARLLPRARDCFDQAMRGNALGRARNCLDARVALDEAAPALSRARRQLAQRWLAVGDERLAAGELQGAQAALQAAREIDPATPELAGFAGRVRVASAGGVN